jgi:hypothetical protein
MCSPWRPRCSSWPLASPCPASRGGSLLPQLGVEWTGVWGAGARAGPSLLPNWDDSAFHMQDLCTFTSGGGEMAVSSFGPSLLPGVRVA